MEVSLSTHKSAWRSTCKSAYKSASCARRVPLFVFRLRRHPGCAGGCKGEGAARLKRKASKTNELRDPSSPRCWPTTEISWHGRPMTFPSTWPRRHRPWSLRTSAWTGPRGNTPSDMRAHKTPAKAVQDSQQSSAPHPLSKLRVRRHAPRRAQKRHPPCATRRPQKRHPPTARPGR